MSKTRLAKPCGIIAGEHMTGSPMCPRSGVPRTGEPNEGRQLCGSVHDTQLSL